MCSPMSLSAAAAVTVAGTVPVHSPAAAAVVASAAAFELDAGK